MREMITRFNRDFPLDQKIRHSRAGGNPVHRKTPAKQINLWALSATRVVFLLESRLRGNDGSNGNLGLSHAKATCICVTKPG
jgi:hypothetical protein